MTEPSDRNVRAELLAVFQRSFGRPPDIVVRAPGRVNLLGAHVDYNDGWVLPLAIDRAVWLAAASNGAKTLRVRALAFGTSLEQLDLEALREPDSTRPDRAWTDTLAGVGWALRASGRPLTGLDVVVGGDLPMGMGLSSSAAVEMALLMAWETAGGFELPGVERARLGRSVENDYLGVESGIMDPFTCVHAGRGEALLLDCRHLSFDRIAIPTDAALLVADTGVRHRLASEPGFNERRHECLQALELLRVHLPELQSLRDVTATDFESLGPRLASTLAKRVSHVVSECSRVRAGASALAAGELDRLGQLMRESHESSRDLYSISTPELDSLAETAWASPGCFGARLTGAGFGGAVLALVTKTGLPALERALTLDFERRYGRAPELLRLESAAGAEVSTI